MGERWRRVKAEGGTDWYMMGGKAERREGKERGKKGWMDGWTKRKRGRRDEAKDG